MALVGGGGAGNIAGSNPAGTSQSLSYYRTDEGTYVWAASGTIILTTADQTCLEFSTGNQLIFGDIEYGADWNLAASTFIELQIQFNDEIVWFDRVRCDTVNTANRGAPTFVIPPYTKFKVIMMSTDNFDVPVTVTLAGRAY